MKFVKKDHLFILAILLTISSTVVILFYPDLVGYSHSYKDLEDKKVDIESSNLKLNQNKLEIIEKTNGLRDMEEINDKRHSEAVEIKRNIREEDFELDMPSFLISMEQQANKDSVDLKIDYNSIRTIDSSGHSDYNEESVMSDEENNNRENEVESNDDESSSSNDSDEKTDSETDNENEADKPTFSEEEIDRGTVEIDGVNVTVIPIFVEGSYSSVRSYIKYLDEVGMIEPASVNLESEEKMVKGKIILNVFHGEVL